MSIRPNPYRYPRWRDAAVIEACVRALLDRSSGHSFYTLAGFLMTACWAIGFCKGYCHSFVEIACTRGGRGSHLMLWHHRTEPREHAKPRSTCFRCTARRWKVGSTKGSGFKEQQEGVFCGGLSTAHVQNLREPFFVSCLFYHCPRSNDAAAPYTPI